MILGVLKEPAEETRIALMPEHAKKLASLKGVEVLAETGLGDSLNIPDSAYKADSLRPVSRQDILKSADIIVRISPPEPELAALLKKNRLWISYLDPVNRKALVKETAARGVSLLSMEFIPRSTLAQKMDALSSQASLAGYEAVIAAAYHLKKIFPMMMTPAGTISPARVFVIGAGVAGLQAIATAKRLGARVEAFDTRPVVEEQVQSLGARFVKLDLGDTGQTKDGYARELTEDQLRKQRELMAKHCRLADAVITTAQVFGRQAPRIVTEDMLDGMKPGSVAVDLAVESGGNIAGSQPGKITERNGVKIIGFRNMPGRAALDASLMFSGNISALITHFADPETGAFRRDENDEIYASAVIARNGEIVSGRLTEFWSK